MSEAAAKLSELRYLAEDAAELIRDRRDQFEGSPGELDQIESRLDGDL